MDLQRQTINTDWFNPTPAVLQGDSLIRVNLKLEYLSGFKRLSKIFHSGKVFQNSTIPAEFSEIFQFQCNFQKIFNSPRIILWNSAEFR